MLFVFSKSTNQHIPFLAHSYEGFREDRRKVDDCGIREEAGGSPGWPIEGLVVNVNIGHSLFLQRTQEPSHLVFVGHVASNRASTHPHKAQLLVVPGTPGACLYWHRCTSRAGAPEQCATHSVFNNRVLETGSPRSRSGRMDVL